MRTHSRTFAAVFGALALMVGLVVAPTSATAQEMTLEQIIAKNVEAKGGQEALDAVESARMQGKLTMQTPAGTMEAPLTIEWALPNKVRVEFTFQGMTGIQAYDGETGWTLMPFMGQSEPQKMTDQELDQVRDQFASLRGPFVEPDAYEMELVGETEIEGTPAYEIKATRDGKESTYYLDQDYFLEFMFSSVVPNPMTGADTEMTTAIGDYKEVGGLMVAHSLDATMEGAPAGAGQSLTFETVEWNVDFSGDHFSMPEVEAAADGEESGR